ncbi:MAG TPA: fibronectin type III domain-containing protein [Solirubrobacteraceae bacterium]|jgi:hypothetical protein
MVRIALGTLLALAVALGPAPGLASAQSSIDLADMFLVERDGSWFCGGAGEQVSHATCPQNSSEWFSRHFLDRYAGDHDELYLRLGKARNDCEVGELPIAGPCQTGVPPARTCPDDSTPYCRLLALKERKIHRGVIMGAEELRPDAGAKPESEEPDKRDVQARSVEELAWHACQIAIADTDRLYDFMFLDQAFRLTTRNLRRAVGFIRKGKYADGRPCETDHPPWDRLITNDTDWKGGTAPLKTGAWAHAKRLSLIDTGAGAMRDAATGGRPVLLPRDRDFLAAVRRVHSRAVLRFEVPSQTHVFSTLGTGVQCSLLTRWASEQRRAGFTFLYPLYVHAASTNDPKGHTRPYDSYRRGTFGRQLALLERYPGPANDDGLPPCEPNPEPAEAPPAPPPPAPKVADLRVGVSGASMITCRSARLNGWIEPGGRRTEFFFRYWERDDGPRKDTGTGHVEADRDREDVARSADGLRPDTRYSARLIATPEGGEQHASEVFSFRTPGRC